MIQTLKDVQLLRADVERLQEELREAERHTISSPSLDGMPRGTACGDRMARELIRRDMLRRKLCGVRNQLHDAKERAEVACRQMAPGKRLFAALHYIDGLPFDAACDVAGMSRPDAWAIVAEVEG